MFDVPQNSFDLITRTGQSLQQLEKILQDSFQERDWLIHQTILALLTRRNVLIYGMHGTAKTDIAKGVFFSLHGPTLDNNDLRVFTIQIDNETTQDDILGPLDIPSYTNKGVRQRNMDLYLPNAHLAALDEIFDGPGVLRQLNDILNEHLLMLGVKEIPVPLHSAIATTNRSPEDVAALLPALNLDAFTDRFLFISEVGYIAESSNRTKMLHNYVQNHRPFQQNRASFRDVQLVAEIIQTTCQYPDEVILGVYQELMESYCTQLAKQMSETVSDRRIAWLTQLPEAQAAFYGRAEVGLEDLLAVAYGLCPNPLSPEYKIFQQVAVPILKKANESILTTKNVDAAVKSLLTRVTADLANLEANITSPNWSPNDPTAIGTALSTINRLIQELESAQPQRESNEKLRKKLLRQADALRTKIVTKA